MISTDQLRKLIEEKKVTIGTDATIRALKAGNLKKLVIAKNAAAQTRDVVERSSAITKIEVESLDVDNDVLGVMCKKPFAISLLGVKK